MTIEFSDRVINLPDTEDPEGWCLFPVDGRLYAIHPERRASEVVGSELVPVDISASVERELDYKLALSEEGEG